MYFKCFQNVFILGQQGEWGFPVWILTFLCEVFPVFPVPVFVSGCSDFFSQSEGMRFKGTGNSKSTVGTSVRVSLVVKWKKKKKNSTLQTQSLAPFWQESCLKALEMLESSDITFLKRLQGKHQWFSNSTTTCNVIKTFQKAIKMPQADLEQSEVMVPAKTIHCTLCQVLLSEGCPRSISDQRAQLF